jgi:hypothetical protein
MSLQDMTNIFLALLMIGMGYLLIVLILGSVRAEVRNLAERELLQRQQQNEAIIALLGEMRESLVNLEIIIVGKINETRPMSDPDGVFLTEEQPS